MPILFRQALSRRARHTGFGQYNCLAACASFITLLTACVGILLVFTSVGEKNVEIKAGMMITGLITSAAGISAYVLLWVFFKLMSRR